TSRPPSAWLRRRPKTAALSSGGSTCNVTRSGWRGCGADILLSALGGGRAIDLRPRPRRPPEQLAAIRGGQISAIGLAGLQVGFRVDHAHCVLRLIAADDNLRADLQRIAVNASAKQRVRRAAFDHPRVGGFCRLGVSELLLDLSDVDPGVWV